MSDGRRRAHFPRPQRHDRLAVYTADEGPGEGDQALAETRGRVVLQLSVLVGAPVEASDCRASRKARAPAASARRAGGTAWQCSRRAPSTDGSAPV